MGTEKNVSSISIDVCRRTVIVKDHSGDSRIIECETTKQFLNAMKIIADNIKPEIVTYAEVLVKEKQNPINKGN